VLDPTVMTADELRAAVDRLARAIVIRHGGTDGLVLIGIQRRGAVLARRIASVIRSHELADVPVGTIDISLYRDDLSELAVYPIVRPTDLAVDINGRTIVLVDDVLFTGRTIRAALGALIDHGRPREIRLAVLIDRGHREVPIRADHVGRNLPTARDERVNVHVVEIDGSDGVRLGRVATTPGADADGVRARG
jgi:pyrimidine operon attenuation protein/uracil phosphoribosyltransferase